jgi:hypothetical protein
MGPDDGTMLFRKLWPVEGKTLPDARWRSEIKGRTITVITPRNESAKPADRDLQHRIVLFLTLRHFRPLQGLQIEVRDGIVTLRGRIDSPQEKETRIRSVQRVAGVSRVVDEMQLRERREDRVLRRLRYSLPPALLKQLRQRRRA